MYDEDEDTYTEEQHDKEDEQIHSDDWGDTESEPTEDDCS
jgi:hypothetical protein